MSVKRALITGATGQDGTYLAQLLTMKGYDVYGLVRGQSNPKKAWAEQFCPQIQWIDGDLQDQSSLVRAMQIAQPTEVYNLAAISFVGLSWTQPELTYDVTGLGPMRVLEAIRIATGSTDGAGVKFYQASSSEMFGKVREYPQNELTPFHPRSPYGSAKALGHYTTVNWRESYGMFACSGIYFNHESSRRGKEFVTRKITRGVARIQAGLQDVIALGNLDTRRDWGFAGDYVSAMWLMLQQDEPDDYVIATGQTRSIKDFLDAAFKAVGIEDWSKYVVQDPRFMRPAEVNMLCGDASKATRKLDWAPMMTFDELVTSMVNADLQKARAASR